MSALRTSFGRTCREARSRLDVTQAQVASTVGVSRGYLAKIERGVASPSLDLVAEIAEALGLEVDLNLRGPVFLSVRATSDAVHGWCVAYVERRLVALGWQVAREVAIVDGRYRGWIDVLAFHPPTGTLLIVEVKTQVLDAGGIERQVGWYETIAATVARARGWEPRRITTWLLVLDSDEAGQQIRQHRATFDRAFPVRADAMASWLADPGRDPGHGRSMAMIDPADRGRRWLHRMRIDGRRSPGRHANYAAAAAALDERSRGKQRGLGPDEGTKRTDPS